MQTRKKLLDNLFLVTSAAAALFVLTELVLKNFGMSVCSYEGCKMTAQYARFGDRSIFAIGFLTFASVAGMAFLDRSWQSPVVNRLINLVLVIALASEGFFMGYLAFRIHTICLICVSIFCFIVVLGILRLLTGEWDLVAGFGALAALFMLQYLVLPAGIPVHLPLQEKLILFYSKDCRHCAELLAELDRKKIRTTHLLASEYAGFLKNMGIEAVPTLMVNEVFQKSFLTGKDAIEQYLATCTVAQKNLPLKPAYKKVWPGKGSRSKKTDTEVPADIFGNTGVLSLPVSTAAGEGMCKQDVICK